MREAIDHIRNMPSVTNPMCAIDEYAMSFFMSFCISATKPIYTMAISDNAIIKSGKVLAPVRHDRQGQPDKTVTTHLQHDRCQDNGAARRRFNVRVRQPCMHRPHRHLDRKCDQEREEDQLLRCHSDRHIHEAEEIEAARLQIQVDKRNQHQHGTEERVQEELEGRVNAALATPDTDDQEHRDQHGFPEDVEQQAIECAEHTDHQPFQDQEGGEILCRPALDRVPPGNHDQRRDERRQQDQWRRNAVDAQVVPDIERLDPQHPLDELHARLGIVESEIQSDARQERQERECQRRHAHEPGLVRFHIAAVANHEQHEAADDREPDRKLSK